MESQKHASPSPLAYKGYLRLYLSALLAHLSSLVFLFLGSFAMAKLEVQSTPRENALPTLAKLGSEVPMGLSQEEVVCIASGWIRAFQEACKSGPSEVLAVFLPDLPGYPPFWRDILALTWDFRTFQGGEAISKFLVDRASFLSQMSEFALRPGSVDLQQPYPDITWIQAVFTFSTDHAECMGVVRLVPMPDQSWKAHTVFTNMQVRIA